MSLNKPAVYKDTFLGDLLNALLLRPPYRKPKPVEPMSRKDEIFRQLRREILAARLKVTLDQQLGRETSDAVRALALMNLPPIVKRRTGVVPEVAVIAAARAYNHASTGADDWDDADRWTDEERIIRLGEMRLALEAALPHIRHMP